MDEINKIPPVTRSLVFATLLVTLPCILQLVSPYVFLLWWQAVVRHGQVWRPITSFFYGGGGISFLFSMFMLLRNSTELETNKFYRKTSEYTWALLIINVLLLAINYPLENVALFNAFQMAIVYLWSRANTHASVNLMGMINCPAKYLPYVYLLFDLLQGGMPAAMRSATGLLAAHIYYFLDEVLPATNGGRGPRYLPAAPAWLRTLLPDSLDPNAAGHAPQPGGTVRAASAHTAFAPAGRSFGSQPSTPAAAPPGSGRRLNSSSGGGGLFSWLPFFGRRGSSTSGASLGGTAPGRQGGLAGGARGQSRPDREAMLAAAEARLRGLRDNSIAGRNQAASAVAAQAASSPEARARAARSSSSSKSVASPSAPAGSVLSDTRPARTTGVSSSGGSEAIRRAGAGFGGGSGPFTFDQARKKFSKDDEDQETASGSGGRVAEIRRAPAKDASKDQEAEAEEKEHSWGTGRQLRE